MKGSGNDWFPRDTEKEGKRYDEFTKEDLETILKFVDMLRINGIQNIDLSVVAESLKSKLK